MPWATLPTAGSPPVHESTPGPHPARPRPGGLCPGLHLLVGQRGEHAHHLAVPLVGPLVGLDLSLHELRQQGLRVRRCVRLGGR
jgi:hypothetical protein